MKIKNRKGELAVLIAAVTALAFSFFIMPAVLAWPAAASDIQTVSVDIAALDEGKPSNDPQTLDINAISEAQAITYAMEALSSLGFDTQDFVDQPVETRYLTENAPAGDPVWAVIFRDDQDGYACAFGDDVNDAVREKIAAIGEVEACTDENGVPGIRAHYSYTRYTLVEINALSGKYVRHEESIVDLGQPLNMGETFFAPTTQEALEQERQRQEKLKQESEQEK